MWPQGWGLDEPDGVSQGFHGVNPTSVTTPRPGGILFEISPFENSHDLLWYMNDYSIWLMEKLLSDTDPLDTGIKNSEITPLLLNMEDPKAPNSLRAVEH